nr:putative ribonuclease H-like domain-containing protein [Tanacetum cinerariifolium]
MPSTPDLSFTGLDEFVNKPVVKNYKAKSSEEVPKVVSKNDDASIFEEWVSDIKEEDVSQPKIEKRIVRPSIAKIEFVKSKQQEKTARKTVKQVEQHRKNIYNYEEIDGGYVTFEENLKGRKIIGKDHIGKVDGKADEGFFVGYSLNSKAFRVFNSRTKIVKENLHIRFSESTPNVVGTQSNGFAGTKASDNAGQARNSTVNTAGINGVNAIGENISIELQFDPNMPAQLFLAYASLKEFVVYQMDVKSAFLYGKIEEEVYVCQPLGFENQEFLDRVYKVEKALYGLHQAPIAWYETLSTYLLDDGFQRGKIDKALFIKRHKGHWYPKDSPFDLVAYTDSDYARASLDGKSTKGEAEYVAASSCCRQVFGFRINYLTMVWSTAMAKTINGEAQLHANVDGKKIVITESSVTRDHRLADEEGIDCLLNSTIFEQLALMGMIRNLDNVPSKFLMYPRNLRGKDAQVPQHSGPTESISDEAVHKELGDSLVRAATTTSSLEEEQDSGGSPRVLDLEKTKTTQFNEVASLKKRVKKLEKRNRSRIHKLKRLYKVVLSDRVESSRDEESLSVDASKQERRIDAIDADKDITLVSVQDDADKEMFDVDDLGGEEDKGKGIMIEKPVKPKKKDQIRLDEEAAKKLQAEFDEEERLARES